ncbi:Zn-ribbon domain-containing OB-fold protein [Chloroflexota bacterium]
METTEIKQKSFDTSKLELLSGGKFNLLGQKCKDCGTIILGRHAGCAKCSSRNLEDVNLSKEAPLVNYSVVTIPPSSAWTGPVPWALAEVVLSEGPAVHTFITGMEDLGNIKIGMEMKLTLHKADQDDEGNEIMVYTWSPA